MVPFKLSPLISTLIGFVKLSCFRWGGSVSEFISHAVLHQGFILECIMRKMLVLGVISLNLFRPSDDLQIAIEMQAAA